MSKKRSIDESFNRKQYGIKVLQSGEGNFALIEQDGMEISFKSSGSKIEFSDVRSSSDNGQEMPLSTDSVKVTQTGNGNVVSIRQSANPQNENLS